MRPLMPLPARPIALALITITALFACGDEGDELGREDMEARIFLDRAERVVIDAPSEERRQYVETLAALPLQSPVVIRVRDDCVGGHTALLEAEAAQLEATLALSEATGGRDDVRVPQEEADRIEAMISRSNEAIGQSRELLRACEDGKRGLRSGPSG